MALGRFGVPAILFAPGAISRQKNANAPRALMHTAHLNCPIALVRMTAKDIRAREINAHRLKRKTREASTSVRLVIEHSTGYRLRRRML